MAGEIPLRWGNHSANFFASANNLRRADHLTDVILTCNPPTNASGAHSNTNTEFSAHKLVLSSCSSYFSNLFNKKVAKDVSSGVLRQTVVHLNNVNPRHLDLILDYMYSGEVNVEEKELVSFLTTAKGLKIKGLADIDTKNM